MVKRHEIYKCDGSPTTVEVLIDSTTCAELECCGNPMNLQAEKTADSKTEKHVPVVEATPNGIKVTVGSVPHPMVEDHYIEWIEVINGPYVNRKYLKPGDKPEAEFYVKMQPGLIVREFCNKHGLWKG